MPRTPRIAPGGYAFHVINRGVNRRTIFDGPSDYLAFEDIMLRTLEKSPMRICAYCLTPNHWHLVLWPRRDGELSAFMQRLTVTHVRCWQGHRKAIGLGHLYQGRYRSFPVETDTYLLNLLRYVEQNPLRAKLVRRAEEWHASSLWRRLNPTAEPTGILSPWPVEVPSHWLSLVNRPMRPSEQESIRTSIKRGRPYGSESWQRRTARQLGLLSAFRSRGRPATVPF